MSSTAIGSHIIEKYIAREHISAYSPVFMCVTATEHQRLYVSQTTDFDSGNPLFVGISQNDAAAGETAGIIRNGFGRGENIYLTSGIDNIELLGTTCIPTEGNSVYMRKGSPVHVGRIIPTSFFVIGITRFPYVKYATAWIKPD